MSRDIRITEVVKHRWYVQAPIIYVMASVLYLKSSLDTEAVFEAIRQQPQTRSFEGFAMIICETEDQANTIEEAIQQAKQAFAAR